MAYLYIIILSTYRNLINRRLITVFIIRPLLALLYFLDLKAFKPIGISSSKPVSLARFINISALRY